MPAKPSPRDQDFFAWSLEQAALLRERKLAEVDLDLIAEEIESLGKTEKRELTGRLTDLLLHLLQWGAAPQGRGASWRLSNANAHDEVADLIDDNPSLKSTLDDVMAQAYRAARRKAAIETDIGAEQFPSQCPSSFAEAIREDSGRSHAQSLTVEDFKLQLLVVGSWRLAAPNPSSVALRATPSPPGL